MAVTSGPQIALRGDIGAEVGLGSSANVNIDRTAIRDLIGKTSGAQNSMSEYYGASADNSLSSYTLNDALYVSGASLFGPASDQNSYNRDPTASQTMYWNRGDQPFDGTVNGSFASGSANTGNLYRYFGSCDNEGTVYCSPYGSFSFGTKQGQDNYYAGCSSVVWAFPYQKITKGYHTFYGNYFQTASSYPSASLNEIRLYLVEYDTWTLDPTDSTRGILSNRVARNMIFSRGTTTNSTNWAAQTWSHSRTTVGRYLVLDFQNYIGAQHYDYAYMSCHVS